MRCGWLASVVLLGCGADKGPKSVDSATAEGCAGEAELSLAQLEGYGLTEGDPILFGNPPQGGAPYAPYRLRLLGLPGATDGVGVRLVATEPSTGTELGSAELMHRFLCSNAGPDAGYFVAPEVHLRFWSFGLDELDGREATLEATVVGADGAEVSARYTGPLQRLP
jgi:hypothetical protein